MPVLDYSIAVVSVSSTKLLTADEAKAQARIDLDAEDGQLNAWLNQARIQVERDTRRQLVSHTYDFAFDQFPCGRVIRFSGFTPLSSVTHLKYIDTDGTLQTWSSSNYEVDEARDCIWLAYTVDWPATRDIQNAVQIRAVFGHAATDEELELAKQAILLLVGHWYKFRESVLVGSISKEIEFGYTSIVERLMHRSYP